MINSIAGYVNKEGIWIDQLDIEFHPLEQAHLLASEAMYKSMDREPKPLTTEEEFQLMVNDQIDLIKTKREEYQQNHAAWLEEHQFYVNAHRQAADAYEAWANSEEGKASFKAMKENHEQACVNRHKLKLESTNVEPTQ